MKEYIDIKHAETYENPDKERAKYQLAKPFPHVVFDDFFQSEVLDGILDEFPDLEKEDSMVFNNKPEIKYASQGEFLFGCETKKFMRFLNSESFLQFLQILTGIEEILIPDPYFNGGGYHEIKRNGLLKIHADFNKHETLGLDRRVNILIYLNKNWKEEYGGHIEFWDEGMKEINKKIAPIFNRMVIFSTTDFSYHGHPNPLSCPHALSRKSLALYYYTNGRPKSEINHGTMENHSTIFKRRKNSNEDSWDSLHTFNFMSVMKEIMPPLTWRILRKIKRFMFS